MPRILVCSLWRNDAHRHLEDRAEHLVSKRDAHRDLRLLWVVGDSEDDTFDRLADIILANKWQKFVRLVRRDSGIVGNDMATRQRRLGVTANEFMRHLGGIDYVLDHESDLVTPADIVPRFLAHAGEGRIPIAGWPTLTYQGMTMFYDTWAYRRDGRRFSNFAPYHPAINGDQVFTVDSFGSCWLARAEDLAGFQFREQAMLDVCAHWRGRGLQLWVDRSIPVIQPADLWEPWIA